MIPVTSGAMQLKAEYDCIINGANNVVGNRAILLMLGTLNVSKVFMSAFGTWATSAFSHSWVKCWGRVILEIL